MKLICCCTICIYATRMGWCSIPYNARYHTSMFLQLQQLQLLHFLHPAPKLDSTKSFQIKFFQDKGCCSGSSGLSVCGSVSKLKKLAYLPNLDLKVLSASHTKVEQIPQEIQVKDVNQNIFAVLLQIDNYYHLCIFGVTRRYRSDTWALILTLPMWPWWVGIPIEDLTDVIDEEDEEN